MVQALTSEARSIYGNPWREDQWNLTVQGRFVARYGEAKAREFAKAAGTTLGALKPVSAEQAQRLVEVRQFILIKKIGGSGGTGSSGSGPPS